MTHTDTLPLFPLGAVLFPGAHMPLHLFEERYRALMRDRLDADPIFGVVLTQTGHEVGDQPEIHAVGTAARLLGANEFPDGRWAIVIEGTRRFRVESSTWDRGYLTAEVEWIEDEASMPNQSAAAAAVIDSFVAYLRAVGADLADDSSIDAIEAGLRSVFAEDVDGLTYVVAAQLPLNTWHRQRLLELPSLTERHAHIRDLLRQERAILQSTGATTWLTGSPRSTVLPN